jgi:hypothetical protein
MKYTEDRHIPSKLKLKFEEGIIYFYKNGEIVVKPNEDGQFVFKLKKHQLIRLIRYINTSVLEYMKLYE